MSPRSDASATQPPKSLLADYRPLPGHYDEMMAADGSMRPAWKELAAHLEQLGPMELGRRWEQAQKAIRDNDVTFNPYEQQGDSRPWELDVVPTVMRAEEWERLGRALAQRARLLEAFLHDIFGPQRLLKEKVLPAELILGHPGFHRAYHSLNPVKNRYLQLYAADLSRAPDGSWWIVGDRTRAPTGLGYVLENRITTSRLLPDAFRTCQVKRLAPFFMALRESLVQLAPRMRDNPRMVLLTRGPKGYSYFEDAYLARYLGYTLAEGGDLAVRNNQVMLKTLGGLLPVEVLLRRMSDDDCDPVELRGDSQSGISGLVEVVRTGNVAVANSLGSQLAETPALLAFLPIVSKFLFNEKMELPSVATWWCGQPSALKYVLEHLDKLIIRPAWFVQGSLPSHPSRLSRDARAELVAAIKAKPSSYIAQEQVVRSTSPVWTSPGLQPWLTAFRMFLTATEDDYLALPGGLIRVTGEPGTLDQSMSAGERSQDVWIRSSGPIEDVSLLQPAHHRVELRRSGSELPSRVAENLFWLGRNVERAEGAARLLRTVFVRLTDEIESGNQPELRLLLHCLAEQGQIEPGFVVEDLQKPLPEIERALPEAVFNTQEPRSLRGIVDALLKQASTVRDRISQDAWRILRRIDEDVRRPRMWLGRLEAGDVLRTLNLAVTSLSAFGGLAAESMTRSLGWRFLELGRRIERAWHTTSLLQSALLKPASPENTVLEALLETADSSMTYRSRYLATIQPAPVIDLLLTDETNPRSIAYQLVALNTHVAALPRDEHLPTRGPEERVALSLLNAVRLADVYELSQTDGNGTRKQLDRLLTRINDQLPRLSDVISNRYLIHAGLPRQFITDKRQPE